jgi:hypothetical protein
MSQFLANQIRVDQARRQHTHLRGEIDLWVKKRRSKDIYQQYHTQLNVLEGVLLGALCRIEVAINQLPLHSSSTELYSACRILEKRVVWIRRVWDYYRKKFDQRDDPVLGSILAAADEVVWSCYAGVFQNATIQDKRIRQGAVPLPYIELLYSPHAIPRAEPPPDLKSDIDAPFLQEYLQHLPIPVVGLPASCIHDPWWLIYLGHEIGHHVQYDLLPDWQLIEYFGDLLQRVIGSNTASRGDERITQRWVNWGREIFADLFSILCMGPWALWTINELELANEGRMLIAKTLYPPPITRLALMHHVINELGLNPDIMQKVVIALTQDSTITLNVLTLEQLDQLPSRAAGEQAKAVAKDLMIAPKVAEAIVGFNIGVAGTLKQLCDWSTKAFEPYQTVSNLASALLQLNPPHPLRNLRGARLFASAAVAAWTSIATNPDADERSKRMAYLTVNIPPTIRDSRQEGTRAAPGYMAEPDIEKLADELSRFPLPKDIEI